MQSRHRHAQLPGWLKQNRQKMPSVGEDMEHLEFWNSHTCLVELSPSLENDMVLVTKI